MKKVLIIGSGIGGLATTIRLLSKGYSVEILEKQDTIGGKVNQINENGHKFDLTATVLMNPNIYKELFSYANRDYSKYIDMVRLDPIYRVNYYDGTYYDFYSDDNKNITSLEAIQKDISIGYMKYLTTSYEKYKVINTNFLEKPMGKLSEMVSYNNLIDVMKINPSSSSYKYLSKYIGNEKILNYLLFQSMYIGINPFKETNLYTLIPTVSKLYGLWYIKGGMYSYIKALEKLIYELGGKIKTNTEIDEIIIDRGIVKGVKCKNKIYNSDIVICNADFPYAIKNLIKDIKYRGKYTDKKIDTYKYSCSTFIIYLALDKKYNNLKTHNIYIGKDFRDNIEQAFNGDIPNIPSVYIYCPSKVDSTMSKNSKETINIMFRVPNLGCKDIDWDNKAIKTTREKVMNSIKNIKGLEDIEEHIIYEKILTPKNLEEEYYSYKGSAFGIGHNLNQVGYFRPNIKSDKVKGLYFIGSSTHPGNGVSVIINGSKLVVDDITSVR
ncbi:MAG: phytoene desaturase family protein [Paraclostridium sp.]